MQDSREKSNTRESAFFLPLQGSWEYPYSGNRMISARDLPPSNSDPNLVGHNEQNIPSRLLEGNGHLIDREEFPS